MQKNTIVIVVIAITVLIIVYMISQNKKREQQALLMNSQVAMINAQTNQQTACQESWVCATTSILTGAGDVLGGFMGGSTNS